MNIKLIPIDQCQTLSIEAIERQIQVRKELLVQMVGSLYPNIVTEEILLLRQLIENRKQAASDYDRAMGGF